MTSFGRLGLSCSAVVLMTALVTVGACSSDDSNAFGARGGASSGGSSSGTAGNAGNAGNGIGSSADAGFVEPDSNVVEVDTFTTSCEAESCTSDEACYETCASGSCCVHACEGQTGSATGEVACCDRYGGIVAGASCA